MSDQDALWPTGPKHSRLGIASFVISIAAVGVFIGAIVIGWTHPVGVDPYAPAVIWLGTVVMLAFTLGVVAIALGITGLFQKKREETPRHLCVGFVGLGGCGGRVFADPWTVYS